MDFSKKVNLKPIDSEKMKIDVAPDTKDTYIVWLELDSYPDYTWIKIFNDKVGKEMNVFEAMIHGTSITMVTSSDGIVKKIDSMKKIIDYTNQQIEIYNKNVEVEHEENQRRKIKNEENIKKMREQMKQ